MKYVVDAVLLEAIQYEKDGMMIVIPQGTFIKVDEAKKIALVNTKDHVYIFPSEYKKMYQN